MNRNHIRHLPVIDNYSLIGVISIRDISTAFDDEATAAEAGLRGLTLRSNCDYQRAGSETFSSRRDACVPKFQLTALGRLP